jgi:hypothetical protein
LHLQKRAQYEDVAELIRSIGRLSAAVLCCSDFKFLASFSTCALVMKISSVDKGFGDGRPMA